MRSGVYVLDTSALVEVPDLLRKLEAPAIVPLPVVGQLKYLTRNPNRSVARKAAKALFAVEQARKEGFAVVSNDGWDSGILASPADNKVVTAALVAKRGGGNPTLITTDRNMRIVARSYGIEALDVTELGTSRKKYLVLVILGMLGLLGLGLFS